MFPLKIILVGNDEAVLPHVRRELLNAFADVETECRDVQMALGRLPVIANRPRLFVVQVESEDELSQIKALSSHFPGNAILALVSKELNTRAIITAMRAGATQVVQLPLRPEDFRAALAQIAIQHGQSAENKVIAVAGVHGGCGATTLAINLASEIALLRRMHCILAEMSLRMGMVATLLNVKPPYSIKDLIEKGDGVDAHVVQQALFNVAEGFDIIAGVQSDVIFPVSTSAREVIPLVEYCRRLADVTILDVPCTYDRFYFEILVAADKIVLVAQQTVPSIRAISLVADRLAREGYAKDIFPVFNRFDPKKPGYTAKELKKFLQMPNVFTIVEDARLAKVTEEGGSIRMHAPKSPTLADLAVLASSLLESKTSRSDKTGRRGRIGRFFQAIGLGGAS